MDTKDPEPDIAAVCAAWKYVSWAYHMTPEGSVVDKVSDTEQTIYEVKQNNAARKVFCKDMVAYVAPQHRIKIRGQYEYASNSQQ